MNLNACTKEQLIKAINMVCDKNQSFKHAIYSAVSDAEFEEEQSVEAEMDAILEKNIALKKQYAELLAPYKGWKIIDIPEAIFSEGHRLEEQIKSGVERYKKLHRKLVKLRQ